MSAPEPRAEPVLAELAAAFHVATEFWDWQGRHVRVPRASVLAVLAALGVDVSSPESLLAALARRREDPWRRLLPAVVVTREGKSPWVRVHVPHGADVEVFLTLEGTGQRRDLVQQQVWVDPRWVDGRLVGEATFELPAGIPLGWHTLHAATEEQSATCPLVVCPQALLLPEPVRTRRAWGFATQLYSVRSRRSWGVGDLGDLADLTAWSGRDLGAGFILVNPLHAAEPSPPIEPSPYLPSSRRFTNPLYLRVEQIPEIAYLGARARAALTRLSRRCTARNTSPDELDRDTVWSAKLAALALIHAVPRSRARELDYQDFCEREGPGLLDFATWCAIAEERGSDWSRWPAELRDPTCQGVRAERERLADRVDFHRWLQWLLDAQLAGAARAAEQAGMPVGVMHDLAVGVHPRGADTWALQHVMAQGVTVGAPPDAFNQQGQDWSQPPWRPDRLAEAGYLPYRDMLRTLFRHAGGIRVDHVIGLFRLWWIPQGASPAAGTYVRYDHEALVGILALEAHRAGAVVVGEDLGTVEPWVRDYLRDRGVLGTSILWFERDSAGQPLAPQHWRKLCLAAVTTHDLPPSAGYLAGEHVDLRARLGLLTRPEEQERAVDEADRAAWLGLLRSMGLLREGAGVPETIEALHRALTWAPALLLAVSLADAAGERRAINQPGTDEEYPNWRLPMADSTGRPVLLEEVMASPWARALARAVSG